MKSHVLKVTFFAILIAVLYLFTACATGGGLSSTYPEGYRSADIVHGAILYDKWYAVKNAEVNGTHPLYPMTGKKSGATTWRCKECHGWDYIGKDGRYRKGSHYTGIKGIYDARTKSPEELYKILTDAVKKHDFSRHLDGYDVWGLVKFIRKGLIDINLVINADGSVNGSQRKGRLFYAEACASCHGSDGGSIDFKKKKGLQGVGWLSNDNPQESLHKIRWGHPGSDMPSAVEDEGMSVSETVDILSYSQTLKY